MKNIPNDKQIEIFAKKKALEYAYANEYQYKKIVRAITEGANFIKRRLKN